MQTLEKALHQPLPFTSSGQTVSDRITAAKHSLAGSLLGKKVCKATTEELGAPKEKHLDFLLHCTNEPNASIPSMATMLIERTQQPSWTVVYKALITIHYTLCYGNERFMQYLISCNTILRINSFIDKGGHDMAVHGHRYAKYINEKLSSYQLFGIDFTKVKRGREDGLLRTAHYDQLTIMLPVLQSQIDTLLAFKIEPSELTNPIIKCSFILLFRDLIRLFACYNDGIINLLEKFFDMDALQCKEALDTYKNFLGRLDGVGDFLKLAEVVGMDEIPDLTRAPASLLEALERHLALLTGAPTPQIIRSKYEDIVNMSGDQIAASCEQRRYLEDQKKRFDEFEKERKEKQDNFELLLASTPPSEITNRPTSYVETLSDLFNGPAMEQMHQPYISSLTPRPSFSEPQFREFAPTIQFSPVSPAPSLSVYTMGQSRPQSTMFGDPMNAHVQPLPVMYPMGQQQFGQFGNNMPMRMPYNMTSQVPTMPAMNQFHNL